DLMERTPPSYAAPDYARVIAEAAARRVLIRTAQAILIDATSVTDSSERVIARCEAALADAARGAGVEDAWVDGSALADRLAGIMDGTAARPSVHTGFHDFDVKCGGIVKGRMNVFAGRPGMGKSAFAVAMMQSMARSGLACGFFSLEMDISELALRMGCGLAFDRYAPRDRNPIYFEAQRGKLGPDQ
ncbi:MAG: DnaB-like helicase C-terminal domain-containing protein, partial [Asticcacaulis sp.]